MEKLSTGEDSTLGNWLKLSQVTFGTDSPAVNFINEKIKESPHGADEEVVMSEGQFLFLLMTLQAGGHDPNTDIFERVFQRPKNWIDISESERWAIDKSLGLLDWKGNCQHQQDGMCDACRKRIDDYFY